MHERRYISDRDIDQHRGVCAGGWNEEEERTAIRMERVEDGEERWHAIGSVRGSFLFLTVVHTYAEGTEPTVRIISARRATGHERKLYEEAVL